MSRYSQESIERLRETVDMIELVGGKTDLRRVGSRWVGLCPFHDERTPSFSVDPQRRLYHCFGCGVGGDAIGFVRETEALSFPEAVETLAERYNVQLEREQEDPQAEQRRRRRERLLSLLERTAKFYATFLWESAEAARARDYLLGRGLPEEVLREFGVGYSPSAWDRVTLAAQRDGFSPEELVSAGLAQRGRGGGLYDRFRARIMFPLADGRGRVRGFGARAMAEGRGPKYLNTSENELYHKGRQLFGLHVARPHAAKSGRVVVVEGYTDVIALHAAGIGESVAIMGTALTPEQLAELGRAAPVVYLALDADRSGMEAMLRAARAAEGSGLELRVVEMPEGADPADLVAGAGADAFRERLAAASSVLEFQVRRVVADGELETPAGRDRVLERARPLIAATPQRSAVRDHLVRLVADRLDVPADYVVTRVEDGSAHSPVATAPAPTPPGPDPLASERAFLTMCVAAGGLGRSYLDRIGEDHLSSDAARRARDHLMRSFEDPLAGIPDDDPTVAALVTGIAMEAAEEEAVTEPVLEMSLLQLELRRLDRELRRAAREGDLSRQDELAANRQTVIGRMDAVMGEAA